MVSLKDRVELKRLVDIYYDVQDVRIRTANRLRIAIPGEVETTYPKSLLQIEKQLKKDILAALANEPIYTEWLYHVPGIGACLAGGLVANLGVRFVQVDSVKGCSEEETLFALKTKDKKFLVPRIRNIEDFPTISKLWAYCGYDVRESLAPKRKRGERANWSTTMRTLCWKIGESFVKQKGFYQMLYRSIRAKYDREWTEEKEAAYIQRAVERGYIKKAYSPKKGIKAHRYAMAKRKTVKIFLQHLWLIWHQLRGLPVTEPYSIEKLGHTSFIEPPHWSMFSIREREKD